MFVLLFQFVIPGCAEGAGPESILTARLALGPFAQKGKKARLLFSFPRMRQAARAVWLWIPGSRHRRAPE
jgi:hypothetical protein